MGCEQPCSSVFNKNELPKSCSSIIAVQIWSLTMPDPTAESFDPWLNDEVLFPSAQHKPDVCKCSVFFFFFLRKPVFLFTFSYCLAFAWTSPPSVPRMSVFPWVTVFFYWQNSNCETSRPGFYAFCILQTKRNKTSIYIKWKCQLFTFKPCDSEIVAGSLGFTLPGFLLLLIASSDTPAYFQNRIHQ